MRSPRAGKPPEVTDAELVCLAVAQVLLRHDDERHWLRAAARQGRAPVPRLLGQSEYNQRLKAAAPLMEAPLRWLAEVTPGSAEMLRLMDATPVPCGHSIITAKRSDLYGWAGYGYCPSHSGGKLLLICTCDGTVTGFGLANPKLFGERAQAVQMLERSRLACLPDVRLHRLHHLDRGLHLAADSFCLPGQVSQPRRHLGRIHV